MPKDTSSLSRHLENRQEIDEVKDECHDSEDERGDTSSSRRQLRSHSRLHSPLVPPEWAKELLRQQQENAK